MSHARCRESKRICKIDVDLERIFHHSFFVSLSLVFGICDSRELSLMILKFALKVD